jgi:hypothetical protein
MPSVGDEWGKRLVMVLRCGRRIKKVRVTKLDSAAHEPQAGRG